MGVCDTNGVKTTAKASSKTVRTIAREVKIWKETAGDIVAALRPRS
jgi:hypothetical protein